MHPLQCTVLEKSLGGLEFIQVDYEVKNDLVTIINLLINCGDDKAMARHLRKAVALHELQHNEFNAIQPNNIVQCTCRSLRNKLP
jgi:hypothetical protein